MTVLQETTNMRRYNYLSFVEWLDMLCRIAIVAITVVDTLDYQVHKLLQLIYNKAYEDGVLDSTNKEHKLRPVDEVLRC